MNTRFPKSILQRATQLNMSVYEGLLRRDNDGGFILPSFQRGSVWTVEQQKAFIESLLMGYPVGTYCVHEDLSTAVNWELLDGQQRWTAIFDFVDDKFEVFGLRYSDFTLIERRMFKGTAFPVYMVSGFTEDEKFELFSRLAYGGTPNSPDDKPTQKTRLA